MKSAFTMIELIFVIVIIGLLVSIAMIKFNVTRDDAKISLVANNIKISTDEIVAYVTAHDKLDNNITSMSKALDYMIKTNQATLDSNQTVKIKMGNISDCAKLYIQKNSTGAILNLSFASTTDSLCNALKNTIQITNYPIRVKGSTLNRN